MRKMRAVLALGIFFVSSTGWAAESEETERIMEAVTQSNTQVLGDAPAQAMGNLYQSTAQSLGNAAHNAANAQQQSDLTTQAATTMGLSTMEGNL